MYSNIRSRAGLVALVFILINTILLVSALPIPISPPQSGLSSPSLSYSLPSHHGQDHIQPSSTKSQISGARKSNLIDTDNDSDRLVRRTNVFKKIGNAIKSAAEKVGSGIKKAAQAVGSGIKKAAQAVGSGIKTAAQKVASGVKNVAQKVGSGIKTAAQKVGHFVKTTGATVAKFGLKVAQTVGGVVAKAASFIPDVGKPLEKAIDGVAKVAGVASDAIHARLSSKLQKGMKVMNVANKVMSYFRREDLSDQDAFLQRDIGDAYYFEEHDSDDIALEHLHEEEFYFDDGYEHYLD